MKNNSRMQQFLSRFRRKPENTGNADEMTLPAHGWKEKALADFKAWLDDLPEDSRLPDSNPSTGPLPESFGMDACDLYTLLAEFTALRQEIKLQNREQNNAIRLHGDLVDKTLRYSALFKDRTQNLENLEERIRTASETRTVERFFNIRDALTRGLEAARAAFDKGIYFRPSTRRRIEGMVEGYEMALRRFDRVLLKFGITPMLTIGQPFNPAFMRAVGKRSDPEQDENTVLEEHLGGFVKGADVLQVAEVVVSSGPEMKKGAFPDVLKNNEK